MTAPAARERLRPAPRSRSAAERPQRRPPIQRVAAHPGGQRVAQLAALANPGGHGVIQRWANLARPLGAHLGGLPATTPFVGLPPTASKTFRNVGPTTSPADPGDMARWKRAGLLGDPSKHGRQALTRMHAIRGKFGGPARGDNMFLGTALSNNFSAQSHYKLVEEPLENYLKGGVRGETRAVDYSVTPNRNSIPRYMSQRRDDIRDNGERDEFTDYANDHIPNGFTCNATLYSQIGGNVTAGALPAQPVSTTVGVAGPPAALPLPAIVPPAVGTALAPVAKAHASASESGASGALGYGALGTAAGSGLAAGYAAVAAHGVTGALAAGYTALTAGGLSGALAAGAAALTGPVGWTALGLGAIGAIYGYATAEND